jgi:hypothetical protein
MRERPWGVAAMQDYMSSVKPAVMLEPRGEVPVTT